jgi:hypothetical protein
LGNYRISRRLIPPAGYLETYAGRAGERAVFLKRLVQQPSSTERLLETLRALRGPALPSILELGSSEEGLWVVTEASEGESLRWVMFTLARAAGFIAPNEGLAVVARVARALDGLHKQGLVHGDVCPATIFLTPRGEVQLHDGGIAAVVGTPGPEGWSRSEVNALAPELITGPPRIATDVFRLGLVLYELAVGRPLWSRPSSAQLCEAVTQWQGLTREKVKQVPEPWLTLLVTMLAVQPDARPSMEEVIVVLDEAVKQNAWSTTDGEIATLFARAAQHRVSAFSVEPTSMEELCLTSLTPPAPPAVVARITTKKMTREMLAVARPDPVTEVTSSNAPLEVRAALLLIERGKLSRGRLQVAQEAAEALGKDVSSFLLDDGAIDEDSLVAAAAELSRTPAVTLKKLMEATPSTEVLALVPLALSRAAQTVPLGLKGDQLMVAMADPMDVKALDQLKHALGARSLVAFRAGVRALAVARARLYGGSPTSQPSQPAVTLNDPLLLVQSSPKLTPVPPSSLVPRVVDTLLSLQGVPGMQAQQLISLAVGISRRLGCAPAEQHLIGLAARAIVTCALAQGRPPHEVPKLAEVQERLGFSEADEFVEALHAFPARMPERTTHRALVLAFAFAAHAGEPRPTDSRLGGALSSFRARLLVPQPMFEALFTELSQ